MPWELPEFMDAEMAREGWQTLQTMARLKQTAGCMRSHRLRITALEMEWYLRSQLLRDADWASMANSLEIRTPLVDWQLLRDIAPLLAGPYPPNKVDLGQTPSVPLPDEMCQRKKTGFIVPVNEWIHGQKHVRGHGFREWAKIVYQHARNSDLA